MFSSSKYQGFLFKLFSVDQLTNNCFNLIKCFKLSIGYTVTLISIKDTLIYSKKKNISSLICKR